VPPELVAGIQIKAGGAPLEGVQVLEARIEDNLALPDACTVKLAGWDWNESSKVDIGKEIELKFGATDSGGVQPLFKGQIASLEPEFGAKGVTLTFRAYDHSHALNRTKKTKTFQDQTFSNIANKVATEAGLAAGTIDSDPSGPHKFVQQSNETDWEFLWRLANRIDFEVVVVDKKLNFRKAGSAARYEKTAELGGELLSFRPRITGVQQIAEVVVQGWDPARKETIESTARVGATGSEIGIARSAASNGLGGGKVTVANSPVMTTGEADALAKSLAARLGEGFLEAEGVCRGDPRLLAGSKIEVKGVGSRFAGKYVVTSTTHVFKGERGYDTHFRISGRAPRSLIDLMTPAKNDAWSSGIVIGLVTNNDDPDGQGRVRVKFPSLDSTEGWWARIASVAAGADRGVLMMPQPGDEVLVGFEQGDVRRPYVLGSLWNGREKPNDLVQKDGSFVLQSKEQVITKADKKISITGKDDYTVELDGKIAETAKGNVSIESSSGNVSIESKSGSVTVKGVTSLTVEANVELTIKCGAAKVTMTSVGAVSISGTAISFG
jgi:phage protein D